MSEDISARLCHDLKKLAEERRGKRIHEGAEGPRQEACSQDSLCISLEREPVSSFWGGCATGNLNSAG